MMEQSVEQDNKREMKTWLKSGRDHHFVISCKFHEQYYVLICQNKQIEDQHSGWTVLTKKA